ncbi:MAG: hypothetical protein K8T91_24655 [Planctomycetes bacterium]|nr:hypothetical protein [Planctomycetota bacterium]
MLMVVPHILVILVCAGVCFASRGALRANLLKCSIFAGLGIIHGLVPAITPEQLRNSGAMHLLDSRFTTGVRTPAAWYALACVTLLALGWMMYEGWDRRSQRMNQAIYQVIASQRGRGLLVFLFWASAGLTLLGLLLQLFSSGATIDEFIAASRFEYRSRDAILAIISGHLMSFGFIPGFIGFFLPSRYRTLGIAFALALTLLLFFVFAKGTRSLPLGLLGGIGVAYVMRYPVTAKRMVMIGGGGAAICFLAISLYEVRKVMAGASLGEMATKAFSMDTYQDSLVSDPLNYHEYLVAAMANIPDRHPYFDGATYRRILFFWMASGWENSWKPEDTNIAFAHILGSAVTQDVTIPPSVPGDIYVNFWGWWGLPAFLVQGLFLAWINRKMQSSVLWFVIFGAMCSRFVLLVLRGQPYDLFVMMLFVFIASYAISWFGPYSFSHAQRDARRLVCSWAADRRSRVPISRGNTIRPARVVSPSRPARSIAHT